VSIQGQTSQASVTATCEEIGKGTKITAQGGLWTVTSCGNGRYGLRCEASKRTYTMPCRELHADLKAGRAFVANPAAYAKQEVSGKAYTNAIRSIQAALS
jgi:hypothetical protein